jgi:ribosomal subunit interface protein
MEIRIQSLKFDADQKLLTYIEKKVAKLSKFFDGIVGAEVFLSLLPDVDNKHVKIRLEIPGNDVVVDRHSKKFEKAVRDCVDVLKEQLKKVKEKRHDK